MLLFLRSTSMQKHKINRSRHAAFLLHVHLVFVTKYRRKILGESHYAAFHQYAAEVCRDFGAELKESNGDVDHVHMLIEYPPTVQLSVLVNSLKAVTSRRLRNEFIDLRGAYGKAVLWSRSYFAGSCGGAPLEVVKQYIQHQRGYRIATGLSPDRSKLTITSRAAENRPFAGRRQSVPRIATFQRQPDVSPVRRAR